MSLSQKECVGRGTPSVAQSASGGPTVTLKGVLSTYRELAICTNRAASGCLLLAVELPVMSGGLNRSMQHHLI
jgi:hypothetical protein